MKESYGKGVATHTGPESCAVAREGGGEALTGERAGQVLSREIHEPSRERRDFRRPTPWRLAEGHTRRVDSARHGGLRRGQRPSSPRRGKPPAFEICNDL